MVVVRGDAGIGKTRLVSEAAGVAESEGAAIGLGECLDYAQAPYAPFVDAMRSVLRSTPHALKDALAVRAILSRLLPELSAASGRSSQANSKRQLFDAYAEAVRTIGAVRPIALIVEDLHWADPDSLDLALHLAAAVSRCRATIVLTYRQDESGSESFASTLARLERRQTVAKISLGPLSAVEMRAFTLELARESAVEGRAVERVAALAEGNPLFAEELVQGARDGPTTGFSPTLRTLILERLRPLTGEQRVVLVHASVIGNRFEPKLLRAAVRKQMADVMTALRSARECHLITEQLEPTSYRFRHALVREVLYRELLEPEAAAIHAKIARALERQEQGRDPVALAYHYWMAKDIPKATAYAEGAGDAAMQASSFGEAATYYERAIAGFAPGARPDRGRLFEKLGRALIAAGLVERALRSFALALDALTPVVEAERRAGLHLAMCRAELLLGDADAAARCLDLGLEAAASAPRSSVRFRVLLEKVALALLLEDEAVLVPTLAAAEGFEGPREPALASRFHQLRALSQAMLGNFADAEPDLEAAVRYAAEAQDVEAAFEAWHSGFVMYGEHSDYERSLAMLERAIQTASEALLLDKSIKSRYMKAELLLGFSITAAREAVDAALAVPGLWDMQLMAAAVCACAVRVGLHQGDAAFVEHVTNEALLEHGLAFGGHYAWRSAAALAELALARGDVERARGIVHRVVSGPDLVNAPVDALIFVAPFADDDDLAAMFAHVQVWTRRQRTLYGTGLVTLFQGFLARAREDHIEAKRLASEAAAVFVQDGSPVAGALALEYAGRQREAAELYRQVGALGDVQRLDAKLAPHGRRDRRAAGLSARELEVARLVAEGKPNKAIASALSISERTVENHVTSIFKKTGATSRAEFIARSARSIGASSPSPGR